MKKKTFMIKLITNEIKPVEGYVSNNFGYSKDNKSYTITHLRTGLKIASFNTQKKTKEFIKRMEQSVFPVSWDNGSLRMGLEDVAIMFKDNANKTIEIMNIVNYGF